MGDPLALFFIFLVVGLFLIGAEIYLPGGVIGVIGALALIGAIVLGFFAFGPYMGFIVGVLIVVLCGVCVALWVKYFPKTRMGRKLTLAGDGRDFKAAAPHAELVGRTGEALSALRPSGYARIDGRRFDVVADGSWIPAGARVQVTAVEGSRVLVRTIGGEQTQ